MIDADRLRHDPGPIDEAHRSGCPDSQSDSEPDRAAESIDEQQLPTSVRGSLAIRAQL